MSSLHLQYVKKKSKEIRVRAEFSTGLNTALKDYHYPLPNQEETFAKLSGGNYFLKFNLSDAYLQIACGRWAPEAATYKTPQVFVQVWTITIRGQGLHQQSSRNSWTPCLVDWNLWWPTWMTFVKTACNIKHTCTKSSRESRTMDSS